MKKPFADYFHTGNGFMTAYKNSWEIWIRCREYFFASFDDYLWINKRLEKRASGGA